MAMIAPFDSVLHLEIHVVYSYTVRSTGELLLNNQRARISNSKTLGADKLNSGSHGDCRNNPPYQLGHQPC